MERGMEEREYGRMGALNFILSVDASPKVELPSTVRSPAIVVAPVEVEPAKMRLLP